MDVTDLDADQLSQAKAQMIVDSINKGETKYNDGDLLWPDDVITDAEAYDYYAGTEFVEDDFFK